ncbi:RNF17 protein, partial [Upupa epops]|nr:RNF17 protein [Upupa epops]
RVFEALVSCVDRDGTIHVIPRSFETALNKLMSDIQCSFKCLGLLEPYCWKKGEACVVRGPDTMWYRGKVVGVGGNALQVQYIDRGFSELIPPCHLYPTTLYTAIPPFCIPCRLHGAAPVGTVWQEGAISCLQELLTNELVQVHAEELPQNPGDRLSISLFFGGMSLASFVIYQKFCVAEGPEDTPALELLEGDAPVLPSYPLPPLPDPGDPFPVTVTHLVTPGEVYICFDPPKSLAQGSAAEGGSSCQLESLEEALRWCNKIVGYLPLLTYFHTDMPCLVEYWDGLWYRGKLLSVREINPVKVLVQFVDYGTFSVVPGTRVRPTPRCLLRYPVRAVRVLLAGIKPAPCDEDTERIPYSPQWSMEALWAMVECVEGKELSASILALSPEVTVSLSEGGTDPVHLRLVETGLAEL